MGLSDNRGNLELNGLDFEKIFPYFDSVTVDRDTDMISVWNRMASSDIFVMNNSTFSYIGALISKSGTIIYPEFEHAPLKNWISASKNNAETLLTYVEQSLIERGVLT